MFKLFDFSTMLSCLSNCALKVACTVHLKRLLIKFTTNWSCLSRIPSLFTKILFKRELWGGQIGPDLVSGRLRRHLSQQDLWLSLVWKAVLYTLLHYFGMHLALGNVLHKGAWSKKGDCSTENQSYIKVTQNLFSVLWYGWVFLPINCKICNGWRVL